MEGPPLGSDPCSSSKGVGDGDVLETHVATTTLEVSPALADQGHRLARVIRFGERRET